MGAAENPPPERAIILAAENLEAAWAQVKTNAAAGAAGVDGRTVVQTAEPLETRQDEVLL